MVGRVAAYTQKQSIAGSVVSAQAVVTQAAQLVAHTCPANKRQEVRVIVNVRELTDIQNLRVRVAGQLIVQYGEDTPTVCASCVVPPLISQDLGNFVINAGETVSANTQVIATEGGTIRLTVVILNEVSIV